MLQEQYARKKKKLYMCFVDLEEAFDRVPRKVIEWALRRNWSRREVGKDGHGDV